MLQLKRLEKSLQHFQTTSSNFPLYHRGPALVARTAIEEIDLLFHFNICLKWQSSPLAAISRLIATRQLLLKKNPLVFSSER